MVFLLTALLGILIGVDLFFGIYIASTLFFIVAGLTVFSLPAIPLFIRMKQKEKKCLSPERNRLWISLSAILLAFSLTIAFFTYLGPLVIGWPPCPIPEGICWAGMIVPYWLHSLFFFGFGVLGVFTFPYLWFVGNDIYQKWAKKSRRI